MVVEVEMGGQLGLGYDESLIEEAAALLESLANNDPFVDGNKRTAFAITDTFLHLNGY